MTSQTTKVKNGKLILPKRLQKSWNKGRVFIMSTADTLIVKKLGKPVKKLSKIPGKITLPKLTSQQIQKEIASYRKGK